MRNRAVVLLSPGDFRHLYPQAGRFITSIPALKRRSFVFDCRYYGIPGHSSSVPVRALTEWIRAAFAVPDDTRDWANAVMERHLANSLTPPRRAHGKTSISKPAIADITLAEQIAKYQLEDL